MVLEWTNRSIKQNKELINRSKYMDTWYMASLISKERTDYSMYNAGLTVTQIRKKWIGLLPNYIQKSIPDTLKS